jgi:hypothetical protein
MATHCTASCGSEPYPSTVTIQDHAEATTTVSRHRTWGIAFAVLALLVAAGGFVAGTAWARDRTDLGGWHTATAHLGSKQVLIEYEGWSYGASGSVESWIDGTGSWHESGWPQCFRVPAGTEVTVRFQAREVTVDGTTWRPIVSIDCRAAGSQVG